MPIGIIGTKLGMTRVFTEAGRSIPVTVVHAPRNYVVQVKQPDTDGYLALQLAVGIRKPSRTNKSLAGHYAKSGITPAKHLREFRIVKEELRNIGDAISVDTFDAGQKVNVVGTTKGKGFAGAIKRHHFHTQDATHGNSLSHRALGSVGQCQFPGRVFKGKKMAGHLGDERVMTKNLNIVRIDKQRDLLLIQGAVPGSRGSTVLVYHKQPVPPVLVEAAPEKDTEIETEEKTPEVKTEQ